MHPQLENEAQIFHEFKQILVDEARAEVDKLQADAELKAAYTDTPREVLDLEVRERVQGVCDALNEKIKRLAQWWDENYQRWTVT